MVVDGCASVSFDVVVAFFIIVLCLRLRVFLTAAGPVHVIPTAAAAAIPVQGVLSEDEVAGVALAALVTGRSCSF